MSSVSQVALDFLSREFPRLSFRIRKFIFKNEINKTLHEIDSYLGQTLFVKDAKIIPDGGIIEVLDDHGRWRIVLVTESKHQGNDIDNVRRGIKVGKNKNQDLMVAGNAIERAHKNISEFANLMILEKHFPYVLFLEGSNFLTTNVSVIRPDGSTCLIKYDSGALNRLDRLTSANYGMPINTNLCENKFIVSKNNSLMLQAASIYTKGDGESWDADEMLNVMIDVAKTSLRILASDLFGQLSDEKRDCP